MLTVTGKSGSGKTEVVSYISDKYNIPMIESHTDRPLRTPNEKGHTFWTPEEFDLFKQEDMIAYTKFGDYRYCCVKSDVKAVNTYVIDETGVDYLLENFKDDYDITTLFVDRDLELRKEFVSKERLARDEGMYYHNKDFYNHHISNNSTVDDLHSVIDDVIKSCGLNETKGQERER